MQERSYHHGNLRAALIDAGLAALEQQDTADLSLRAIARDVGVSANAAYRHFADKEALLSALAAEGFRRFAQHQGQAMLGHADQKEARLASGQAYVRFARDNPALFRLMFGRMVSKQINATTDVTHAQEELHQMGLFAFQGLLHASAQESGAPPDSERALLLAIARWSLVHGLSHLMLDGQLAVFGGDIDKIVEGVLMASSPEPQTAKPPEAKAKPKIKASTSSKAAKPRSRKPA